MGRSALKITFQATLFRPEGNGDWTFLRLPQESSDLLPTRSMISIEGTLNGHPFQKCLQPDGQGGHWLKVDSVLGGEAKVSPGEMVDLEISPMATELEPEIPRDLQSALECASKAYAVWLDITPLARRDWIHWMTSGKKAETRPLRLEKMVDMLSKGKRRICCFDRSGIYSKALTCPKPAEP